MLTSRLILAASRRFPFKRAVARFAWKISPNLIQAAVSRTEQDALLHKIHDIQKATPAPVDQAIEMMGLTSRACELFLQQAAVEQRRLLQVVIKQAAWQDGTLRTILFEPFEILRHSNRESSRKENENPGSGRDLEVWLLR